MPDRIRLACVQLTASADKAANLAAAERLVACAAEEGAKLVVLPEKWNGVARSSADLAALAEPLGADIIALPEKWNGVGHADELRALAEPVDGGESSEALASWARTHGVSIVGGSITERRAGRDKLSNTSLVFAPDGTLAAVYRKIHLFDVEVGDVVYRESEAEEPGDEPVVARVEDWTVGLTVCYDVRFPELYRLLALHGAELVTVPANFTERTGRDHWEVLLRARAIENQCYVAAPAQVGEPMRGRRSYGRSSSYHRLPV